MLERNIFFKGFVGATFAYFLLFSPTFATAVDDPWADRVVSANINDPFLGYDNPLEALGAPLGGGVHAPSNGSIVSIGVTGSSIVLGFDTPVVDDPANPLGMDFIVFSNAFWTGGNPQNKFVEPALIEVSGDVNGNGLADDAWYVIPGSRALPQSTVPAGMVNPAQALAGAILNPNSTDGDSGNDNDEFDWGYAELSPTRKPYRDNYLRPDDPYTVGLDALSGGGDAFDIAWAVDNGGGAADLGEIHFVRIWSFITGSLGGLGTISPEIDSVADVDPLTDTDNDGVTDAYEVRVSGTDPNQAASTVIPLETEFPVADEVLGTVTLNEVMEVTFVSSGLRSGVRDFNMNVTLGVGTDPGDAIAGKIKSNAVVEMASSLNDFVGGQIAPAEVVIEYTPSLIVGMAEESLRPWRHDGAGYTQGGISDVVVDPIQNQIYFTSRYSGIFILAGDAGPGDVTGELPGPSAWWGIIVLGLCGLWRVRRYA